MDIGGTGGSRVRSYYSATSVTDVALYTEPEEIYLMAAVEGRELPGSGTKVGREN